MICWHKDHHEFNAIHYGLYTNEDYGNARGVELKYDYTLVIIRWSDYTLQYTRGMLIAKVQL